METYTPKAQKQTAGNITRRTMHCQVKRKDALFILVSFGDVINSMWMRRQRIKRPITIKSSLVTAIIFAAISAGVLIWSKSLTFKDYSQRERFSPYIAYLILFYALCIGVIIVCAFLLEQRNAKRISLKFPFIILFAALVFVAQIIMPSRINVGQGHIAMECLELWCSIPPVVNAASSAAKSIFLFYYILIFIFAIWIMHLKLRRKPMPSL